jgi:hypothetical protein
MHQAPETESLSVIEIHERSGRMGRILGLTWRNCVRSWVVTWENVVGKGIEDEVQMYIIC